MASCQASSWSLIRQAHAGSSSRTSKYNERARRKVRLAAVSSPANARARASRVRKSACSRGESLLVSNTIRAMRRASTGRPR